LFAIKPAKTAAKHVRVRRTGEEEMQLHHFWIILASFFCGSVFTSIIYAIVSGEYGKQIERTVEGEPNQLVGS
jgi:hypothetical protein